MIDQHQHTMRRIVTAMPDGNRCSTPCPELLTEDELYPRSAVQETTTTSLSISNGTEGCPGYASATRFCTQWRPFENGLRRKRPTATNLYGIGLMSGYNGDWINLSLSQHKKGDRSWLNSW